MGNVHEKTNPFLRFVFRNDMPDILNNQKNEQEAQNNLQAISQSQMTGGDGKYISR
ncbi:hypothetical protein FACS189426_13150 [Bacteroidia bacterium]|nr:hypothetical protein FACS189426_13150 [Bacteroidia bacterium]